MSDVTKHQVLDYDVSTDSAAPFRRVRFICTVGVTILWAAIIVAIGLWLQTSNSAAPGKAEIAMAYQVLGGMAITWLLIGLRRILQSYWLRRDWLTWLVVLANLAATPLIFPFGYN